MTLLWRALEIGYGQLSVPVFSGKYVLGVSSERLHINQAALPGE